MLDRPTHSRTDRVAMLVHEILAQHSTTRHVARDDQLTDSGMTSVDMVNLMLAVEAEFDIMIPAADITPENFRSISTIEALVAKLSA